MNTAVNTKKLLMRDEEVLEKLTRSMGAADHPSLLPVENLVHLLKTYSVIFDALSDGLAPYDLSVAQYNLLAILRNVPEHHLPMSEIGERMSVTRTNITKLVDCLERSNLVRRANQPGDRRVVLAELTAKGISLLERLTPQHLELTRHLWNDLTQEECRELTHLLLKLRHSAQKFVPGTREQSNLSADIQD